VVGGNEAEASLWWLQSNKCRLLVTGCDRLEVMLWALNLEERLPVEREQIILSA
jgi:hypothetical protein